MDFKMPKEVQTILDKFQKANFQIFIVGGAVRDLLMGKSVKDWDFTTDAKPDQILKLFPEGFYNNKFGTVGIPIKRRVKSEPAKYEITTMRKEGEYKDFRHPSKVGWTNKIAEDLARRDFTINAIALRLRSGRAPEIIDPYHGQDDINARLIRVVGDPNQRFKEDALRLIRAIRISTELEFDIEKSTFLAIQENAQLIKEVANERIRDELLKILTCMNPYMGMKKLREAGILQIILPELERCFGIVQQGPKHARVYDIGEHSLLTLKYTPSSDVITRFASLLHDIGKVDTHTISSDGNVTFYNHDVRGGQLILEIAKRFNLSRKDSDKLFKLVRWHMFSVSEHQTDSAIRRFIKNIGLDYVEEMMALRVGDRLGGGTQTETSWRMEKFASRIKKVLKKPFSITDLKVNGNDVMKVLGVKPGPKVGEVLQKLFEEVLEDSSKNNSEYLLNRIKQLNQ